MAVYDYIVIGAGSAGCAVAGRLTAENPSRTVLLIESGGSERRLSVRAPLAYPSQLGSATDWGLESEPEPGCGNRRIPQPRGKVLGGTSAMNAMVWVRGCPLDYDGWGLPGWGWGEVEPVFRRIESGPMRVSRLAEPDDVSRRFVGAARTAGVAATDDISGPDLDGAAISPVTVWRGRRWSAARAYVDAARRRRNFKVVTRATVARVLIRDGHAVGCEYERHGRRHIATARAEVVLSAGAFGTPQLLQLSGIGAQDHLRSIGVTQVVESPRVGQNLTDHPATVTVWELAGGRVGLSDVGNPKWLLQWIFRRNGKLASNLMEALAHVRSAPALAAPDFQLIAAPLRVWPIGGDSRPRPGLTILQSYWTPESRGTVLARSSNPVVPPAIQLNTLAAPADIAAFKRAIRLTYDIVAAEPLASALGPNVEPGPRVDDDAALEKWIRETVWTTGHPACTAAMGTDDDSVLDERLRVRGVAGLRVADASAFPRIPRANTNAAAILVGERCADLLLEAAGS
jgi:choline dehydrogenase